MSDAFKDRIEQAMQTVDELLSERGYAVTFLVQNDGKFGDKQTVSVLADNLDAAKHRARALLEREFPFHVVGVLDADPLGERRLATCLLERPVPSAEELH